MALTTLDDVVSTSASSRESAVELGKIDIGSLEPRLALKRAQAIGSEWGQRVFDVLVVVLTLPVVALTIAIAALLIRREDRGSIFFLQPRIGRDGQRFMIYKLRTMRVSAGGEATTSENDERVTRVGRILRKYRIDELPQILNVLRGEMSIVGPRPEVLELSKRYSAKIPHYKLRHRVRPGLTGWAQVRQGYTSTLDAATEKLSYDLFYVFNRSLWLDLRILLLTVGTLAKGEGAR